MTAKRQAILDVCIRRKKENAFIADGCETENSFLLHFVTSRTGPNSWLSKMADWSDSNSRLLLLTLGCSVGMFALVFCTLMVLTRLHFSPAKGVGISKASADPLELVLIKRHTRVVRVLAALSLALQAPLLVAASNVPSSYHSVPYSLRLVRPIANICGSLLGFTTNTHAAFRVAYLLVLAQMVAVDTVSEVLFSMSIACLELQGLQCGPGAAAGLSLRSLRALEARELAALLLGPWLLLEVGFLAVSIGPWSSRFSARQLSLSRPAVNLRAALAEQFGAQRPQYRK